MPHLRGQEDCERFRLKPRRVIAKVEWHPGELYPRVGFIVTNMSRAAENVASASCTDCSSSEAPGAGTTIAATPSPKSPLRPRNHVASCGFEHRAHFN